MIREIKERFMMMVKETQAISTAGEIEAYLDDAVNRANDTFFMVRPVDMGDLTSALEILSYYDVVSSFAADHAADIPLTSLAIKVIPGEREGDFRLCEMAFEMNHRQAGFVCDICASNGETTCGHLTFTSSIR